MPDAPEPLTAGPRTVGPYTIRATLGTGGMGQVFRAGRADGPDVALKELQTAHPADRAFVDRFRKEVAALRALPPHQNVVAFVDADPDAPRPYLVMELLAGGHDLRAYSDGTGPLPFAAAAELVLPAAAALGHMHAHGLVHRDVKPSNLFRCADGTVKVIDFGLVQLREPGADPLTASGAAFGTPGYTAPEQWENAKRADARADLFGLGEVLYFLLTREAPFPVVSAYDHELKDLSAKRPDLTAAHRSFLRKAVRHEPAERYQTAGEFADALRALLVDGIDARLNSVGMAFVRVPAAEPLWLGAHQVTRAQYARVLGEPVPTDRADHPVAEVSWDDAVTFCARLSQLPAEVAAGRRYRLPTEAEWEFACRARSDEAFAFGPELTADRARFTPDFEPSPDGTGPVAEFPPNAFGLYGMHGNVWEWCADPFEGVPGWRAQRGGSFRNFSDQCSSSFRKGYPPDSPRDDTGFRVVLVEPA